MNKDWGSMAGGESSAPEAALAELRSRLESGLAQQGVTKTVLARRAGLGRTVVSEAFNRSAPAPSARTVGTLAVALKLDVQQLLDVRAVAVGARRVTPAEKPILPSKGIGRPITECDPHELEVHPAIDVAPFDASPDDRPSRRMPGYVRRRHDRELGELVKAAAEGNSGMAVLVGSSSTGKTRACWEAIQPLALLGWRVWHPYDPTRAEAALNDLQRLGPRTVLWLNEAQHYIGASGGVGERIAAALRSLLSDKQVRPLLVLGTLWNNYAAEYTTLPTPGRPDLHTQTRELLAGRLITLPKSFDALAIKDARNLASKGDLQLAQALRDARYGQLTQYLAGAPALHERYKVAGPSERALIEAAMDARRLGVGSRLRVDFLAQAASDYLADHEYADLEENWIDEAFCEVMKPVHGNLAPLTPIRRGGSSLGQLHQLAGARGNNYKLADALEQLGRHERRLSCPPESFWEAVHACIAEPAELAILARAAHDRHRLYWAHCLTERAAAHADSSVLVELADMWMEGHPEQAEHLQRRAAAQGHAGAMHNIAFLREESGDAEASKEWHRRASEAGDPSSTHVLAGMYEEAGDLETAETLYRKAIESGDRESLGPLARIIMDREGDPNEAISLLQRSICFMARQTARLLLLTLDNLTGAPQSTVGPWRSRKKVKPSILLIEERADAGDYDGLLEACQDASREGDPYALFCLYSLQHPEEEGRAIRILESAARKGNSYARIQFARVQVKLGNLDKAEALYRESLNSGDETSVTSLASLMQELENFEEAESLYWKAIESGNMYALCMLSKLREETGDREGAEEFALQAANAGDCSAIRSISLARSAEDEETTGLWPHGLNPDGTPTSHPWWPRRNRAIDGAE